MPAAPATARYRVLVGTVWHRAGRAGPGAEIEIPTGEGDPLCAGPEPVLLRMPAPAAPAAAPDGSVGAGVASRDAATDGSIPAPPRPRRATKKKVER
jgi:hypothetical protein